MFEREMEGQKNHFSHTHNLTIHQIPVDTIITCSGCNLSGTATVYACRQCNFFLHEQCFLATRSLQHHSHPSHPLTLLPFPTYPSNSFFCNSCGQAGTGFTYCCSDCEFDLHVHCAYGISMPSNLTPASHIFRLQIPPPNQALDLNAQQVYMPHQTAIHQAIIPNDTTMHYPLSNHTPTFNPQNAYMPHETSTHQPLPSYSLNQQTHSSYNPLYASIPHQELTTQSTNSSPIQKYSPISAQDSQFPQPIRSNDIQSYTPLNRTRPSPNASPNYQISHAASHKPINPNVKISTSPPKAASFSCLNETIGASSIESPSRTDQVKTRGIMHFSHRHALCLVNLEAEEDSTKCSACEEVISGSRYSCSKSSCDFHLDKSCFLLAQKIQHKSHPENPLTLISNPYDEFAGNFSCSACQNDGTRFTYHCATCQFDLHIQCASLLETVKRDDHDHQIKLFYSCPNKEQGFSCDACHGTIHEDLWAYYCGECDYSYHVDCVNDEEQESSTGNPILDAEMHMQRLQIRMEMSRQNAQFMMNLSQSIANSY